MITLAELFGALAASGRPLTPRSARDWWTKGLLPRPLRRGRGRGLGTETFWTDRRVITQAEATYDFLAEHSRCYSAALHLWLSGFQIDPHLVREAYQRIISRHYRSMREQAGGFDNAIAALAARAARQFANSKSAPGSIQHDITDLISPYLHLFFGSAEEFENTGLSDLWAIAQPYIGHSKNQASFVLSDNQLQIAADYLKQIASLGAQQDAIASATDYEMMRARRLVHFVFGHLRRFSAPSFKGNPDFDEIGRRFLIVSGRPSIPILITALRSEKLRRSTIRFLLDLVIKARGQIPEVFGSSSPPR
jgi:hypothetical protein